MSGKMDAVIAALMGKMPLPVRPFDPASDAPADLGLGGVSTEVLGTYQTPQGDYVNIPSAWFVGNNGPFLVDDPMALANDYEVGVQKSFPRYDALDQAVMGAQYRSATGGASGRSITDPMATMMQRGPLFGFGFWK